MMRRVNLVTMVSIIVFVSSLTPLCEAIPVEWSVADGGNGHYYEVVASGITWLDAKDSAEQRIHLGFTGYLTTITSADEQTLVADLIADTGIISAWAGGYQPDGSPEPGGNWQWITGENWDYTNWLSGEPSNGDGLINENALHIYASDSWARGK